MPNMIAYLALIAWPGIAIALFRLLPLERAVIWSILGPYLFLPPVAAFDFPLIPRLDKVSIPNASAFLICVVMLGHKVPILPRTFLARLLVLLFLLTPIAAVLTNSDPITFVIGGLPGLQVHDSISAAIAQGIALTPLLLGRRFLGSEAALRELLIALVIAGLVYSLPMLVEIRLSPQLNVWIYGFFQHDFGQMMRQGGYRPIVFLQHGLWVAFLTFLTLIAAVALWRWPPTPAHRGRYFLASGYLAVMLVLCKSAAVLVYAAAALPLARFAKPGTQLRMAALLGLVAISYPLLRGAELVPVEAILKQAEAFGEDRADSLAFRFNNEELLLEHGRARPWFGWGGWGRNQIYDPFSGQMVSVSDGRWVIIIGTYGWFGYIAEFGLLGLPLFMLARRSLGRGAAEISPYAGPIALMLGFNMVDMLPNATLTPFTWLLAGALLAYAEAPEAAESAAAVPTAAAPPPRSIL
jgi:hypothetical protein